MKDKTEVAECRNCTLRLDGKPYHLGGTAYVRRTNYSARHEAGKNWYGGFVCSEICDEKVCLEMESSFPGVGPSTRISDAARRHIENNWPDND